MLDMYVFNGGSCCSSFQFSVVCFLLVFFYCVFIMCLVPNVSCASGLFIIDCPFQFSLTFFFIVRGIIVFVVCFAFIHVMLFCILYMEHALTRQ